MGKRKRPYPKRKPTTVDLDKPDVVFDRFLTKNEC